MTRYVQLTLGYQDFIAPYSADTLVNAVAFMDQFKQADTTYVDTKDDDNSDIYWYYESTRRAPRLTITDHIEIEAKKRPEPEVSGLTAVE
tara:strand:+ start:97 stop:366 length:270 start_codon:yes stop_codon:yes gene_type:complete